jgi:hypothetical protein
MRQLGKLGMWMPALVIAGCMTGSLDRAEPQTGPDRGRGLTDVARIGTNTLSVSELTDSALTTVRLDEASAAVMAATEEARKVLTYAVRCALDGTQTFDVTIAGITYSLHGGLGIAPGWTNGALSATQAAWVSACVLAHATDESTLIWLSVRGAQPGLATTVDETAQFQIEEGAFWGNVFVDSGAVGAYSCNGLGESIDDGHGDLPYRTCARWDGVTASNLSLCGMRYAGRCSAVCTTTTAPYAGCSFHSEAAASAVITTFLAGPTP